MNTINFALGGYLFGGVFLFIHSIFKTKKAKTIAAVLVSIGFIAHTLFLLNRGFAAGHFPIIGIYESLIFFAWAFVLVYFILKKMYTITFLEIPVMFLAAFALGYTSILDKSIKPLIPALKSNWITIHVTSYFLGYAAVTISFIVSLRYLFTAKKSSPQALTQLDTLSYRMVSFAFPFLTIGLTTGAVWAKVAWGSYWSWDPKETWAFITWCIYASYLHLRFIKNWQGKKACFLNIIGFFCVLFTFLGVNYLLKGLHSYL